jgi:hypothetical protein
MTDDSTPSDDSTASTDEQVSADRTGDAAGSGSQSDGGTRSDGSHAGTADDLGPDAEDDAFSWDRVRRGLIVSGIGVLGLLATWATFQIYGAASQAISIWLSEGFVPIFQALFNTVVVLVALAGILWLVRQLS